MRPSVLVVLLVFTLLPGFRAVGDVRGDVDPPGDSDLKEHGQLREKAHGPIESLLKAKAKSEHDGASDNSSSSMAGLPEVSDMKPADLEEVRTA